MEVNAKSPHKNEELQKALAEWSGNLEEHLIGDNGQNRDFNDLQNENPLNTSQTSGDGRGNNNNNVAILVEGDEMEFDPAASQKQFTSLLKATADKSNRPTSSSTSTNANTYTNETTTQLLKEQRSRISQLETSLKQAQVQNNAVTNSSSKNEVTHKQQMQQVVSENMKLLQRIRTLETTVANTNTNTNASVVTPTQVELQTKCSLLMKERDAVCTIMEQKIKVLVQNISQAVSVVLHNEGGNRADGPGQALNKVCNV